MRVRDLYSVGVSLYELVTGKRPFDGDSQFAIMSAHLQGTPVPPVTVDPRLPQLLNDVILMSVAKDANARFQTAAALRNALANVARRTEAAGRWPRLASCRPLLPASAPAGARRQPVQPEAIAALDGARRCGRGARHRGRRRDRPLERNRRGAAKVDRPRCATGRLPSRPLPLPRSPPPQPEPQPQQPAPAACAAGRHSRACVQPVQPQARTFPRVPHARPDAASGIAVRGARSTRRAAVQQPAPQHRRAATSRSTAARRPRRTQPRRIAAGPREHSRWSACAPPAYAPACNPCSARRPPAD